jgi:hypothetical protein
MAPLPENGHIIVVSAAIVKEHYALGSIINVILIIM